MVNICKISWSRIWVFGTLLIAALGFTSMGLPPSREPVMEALRESFTHAHSPSVAELQLGRTWNCRFYGYGGGGPTESRLSFSQFDGLVMDNEEHTFGRTGGHWVSFTGKYEHYTRALIRRADVYTFLRVSQKGDLIIEVALSPNVWSAPGAVSGVFDGVYRYGVCPLDRLTN